MFINSSYNRVALLLVFSIFLFSIDTSNASVYDPSETETTNIYVEYYNLSDDFIINLKRCLSDNKINIIELHEKNLKRPRLLDDKHKLFKYYKSSLEIYFYFNTPEGKPTIDDNTVLGYYYDVEKSKIKSILNRYYNKKTFTYTKWVYNVSYRFKNNNVMILLTNNSFPIHEGKHLKELATPRLQTNALNKDTTTLPFYYAITTLEDVCIK